MKISASNDHWVHLRHNSVPHERPLRDAQRNLTDRGALSRQHKAPVEPRGNRIFNHVTHIAAVTQLRHDTIGGVYFDKKIAEDKTPERSDPGVETTYLRRRPQEPHHRRSKTRRKLKRVGPGGHPGTTLNPRCPACILKTGSSDNSLPESDTNNTPIPQRGIDFTRPQPPRKQPPDTKRLHLGGNVVGSSQGVLAGTIPQANSAFVRASARLRETHSTKRRTHEAEGFLRAIGQSETEIRCS